MKHLIALLIPMVLSGSLLAIEVKDTPSPPATDTVKSQTATPVSSDNQQILNQEDEQEREEMEAGDVLDEFGNNTYNENGNGSTTNPRIDWPEP